NTKKLKKAVNLAITTSFLLMGEAVVKTVLSSPSSLGLPIKLLMAGLIKKNIPTIPVHHTLKNIFQMVLKIGYSSPAPIKVFLPENAPRLRLRILPMNSL
ncbi:16223_t:CDS:1, partial [Funneliformis geosporum]